MSKKIIQITGIILLVCVLFTFLIMPISAADRVDQNSPLPSSSPSVKTPPATSAKSSVGKSHDHYFGSQLTTPQERQLYSIIEDQLLTSTTRSTTDNIVFNPPIKLTSSTNPQDPKLEQEAAQKLKRALDAFKFDHPEYFWITGNSTLINMKVRVYDNGEIYLHSSGVYFELQPVKANDIATINSVVNQISNQAKKQTTDYARIKTVHDMLINHISYGGEKSLRSYQISGGLVDKLGTCEAYSKSFKLIMNQLGYDCIIVAGTGYDKGKAVPHMWNYVKLNGSWYAVDVTWDDQKIIVYDYLLAGKNTPAPNFGDRTFGKDHVEEHTFSYIDYAPFYYPQLSSTAYTVK